MHRFHLEVFVVISVILPVASQSGSCDRSKCRTVRNVIYQELVPQYKAVGAKIPYVCPFFKDRDKYIAQEEHKERESLSRWACGYCGKAFIGEIYLDQHFSNRHANTIYKETDAVCLSDFCEVFRCDVLMGVAKPTFWDVALCMEEDMKDLTTDCEELMARCIPDSLNWNATKTLKSALFNSVCSFLTCKKYFDAQESVKEEDPVSVSYVVLTVVLSISLVIYYCVAINYFWLDTFADVYDSDTEKHPESLSNQAAAKLPIKPHSKSHKRKKQNVVQFESSSGQQDIFSVNEGLSETLQAVPDT